MSEYTPTTGQVFDLALLGAMDAIGEGLDVAGFRDQFDRWLAAHDRQVAAKAWDEGARHVYAEGGKCSFARDGDPCPYNPYRGTPEQEVVG